MLAKAPHTPRSDRAHDNKSPKMVGFFSPHANRAVLGGIIALVYVAWAPIEPSVAAVTVEGIASVFETQPVGHTGDAADDAAVWVNPNDPALSLIVANDKRGALESYDLGGIRVQRISTSTTAWGNVDVRGDYVAASNGGVRIYRVDPATRMMVQGTDGTGVIKTSGEGLCLYDPGQPGLSDKLFVFTITRAVGRVRQYQLDDPDLDQLLSGTVVRDFTLGTEAEGCVANDATGDLFISEEDVALWRYGANPSDGNTIADRTMVAAVGPDLPADSEGVALAGGYLFVSAQNVALATNNWVNVYQAIAPYSYVKSFRVTAGAYSDDCDRTDGVAVYAGSLGSAFPDGIFVCQDNSNGPGGSTGAQDFKYVPYGTLGLVDPPLPNPLES